MSENPTDADVHKMQTLNNVNCLHKGNFESCKGKKIMVAIDGSSSSNNVFENALKLMDPTKDHLFIVTGTNGDWIYQSLFCFRCQIGSENKIMIASFNHVSNVNSTRAPGGDGMANCSLQIDSLTQNLASSSSDHQQVPSRARQTNCRVHFHHAWSRWRTWHCVQDSVKVKPDRKVIGADTILIFWYLPSTKEMKPRITHTACDHLCSIANRMLNVLYLSTNTHMVEMIYCTFSPGNHCVNLCTISSIWGSVISCRCAGSSKNSTFTPWFCRR